MSQPLLFLLFKWEHLSPGQRRVTSASIFIDLKFWNQRPLSLCEFSENKSYLNIYKKVLNLVKMIFEYQISEK